jgi:hypothetical protein
LGKPLPYVLYHFLAISSTIYDEALSQSHFPQRIPFEVNGLAGLRIFEGNHVTGPVGPLEH